MDTRDVVEAFVKAINGGHAERVSAMMNADHEFIDSLGKRMIGRRDALDWWRAWFRLFPDYRIEVDRMFAEESDAVLHGRASGTLHRDAHPVEGGRWEVPAAWRAVADGRRVTLWQAYADHKPVRDLLAP